jgi:DNA-binding NtrC family response regulator
MVGGAVDPSDAFGATRRIRHPAGEAQVVELPAVTLSVLEGPDRGKRQTFTVPLVRIGTAPDNDLVLKDDSVSRHHARLARTERGLILTDQDSTNGTFVQGVRTREAFLEDKIEFALGDTRVQLRTGREKLLAVTGEEERLGAIVGKSAAMREVYALLLAVAKTPTTVLVEGESGTGKELGARAVHELSGRKGPLVVFDCASTGPELIGSELFGHVAGAFTGAAGARQGAFRQAHGGTLFIDELGELPLAMQPMLLRVLETREVKPLGSDKASAVDVRLVAATNRDLPREVAAGRFREDLFHRLAVVRLRLPPLRERRDDVPLLVEQFVEQLELDVRFSAEALAALSAHDWPGNVRALRNAVELAGALRRGQVVRPADLRLPAAIPALAAPAPAPAPAPVAAPAAVAAPPRAMVEIEREALLDALARCGGNRTHAARMLGISLSTLKRRLREYGQE